MVDEARQQYTEVKENPEIVKHAPNALQEAEEQFKVIKNLSKNGGNRELINHHAYIAQQKIAMAREMAVLNDRQDQLAKIEREHQTMLAQVQEMRAEEARRRAEQARIEAEQAKMRSEELAAKLTEIEAEKTERGLVVNLRNVLFDPGKATFQLGSADNIAKLSRFLLEYTDRTVLVEGFTDNTGSRELNQRLSEKRAEAVKQALVASGVEPERIFTRGYGEDYAVVDNATAAGRMQNRRVEVVISDENGTITARRSIQ
jgi:outer membrane protein OmpA-like peptidoglycan-associated protein